MGFTRRDFITKTSSAVLFAGAVSPLTGLSFQKSGDLKVGIIGTGDRGTGLAHLIKNIEGMEVVGMCDIIPFRLEESKKFGTANTKYYKDYRELLDQKDLDALMLTSPFSMHSKMALDTLEAGKHIYCEKTMTYGIESTREVVKAARSSNQIFQTGHQYHSSRLYHHVAQLIREGHLGDITLIDCQWNRNGNWRRPVPDSKWEKMINWRMYREYSGGLTAELCSHQIDFANWILGGVPKRVSGFGGVDYWKDGRETYDNVHLLCEYENGVKATFTSLTTNSKDGYRISVHGKKGSIVITRDKAWFYSEEAKDKSTTVVDGVSGATSGWSYERGKPINVEHKEPTLQALIDFRDSVLSGKQPESNVETGGKVSIIVQMALNAMDSGSVQHWKDEYNL
jgi:predicted dehydrogenase